MKLTVCSVPATIPDEHKLVQELMRSGLTRFHLRKPTFSKEEIKTWLQQLSTTALQKVVLHSHWSLADEFELKGFHFGASVLKDMPAAEQQNWWLYAKKKRLTISSSVHDEEEIHRLPLGVDEVWLSPIYESISKTGYQAAFSASQFDDWTKYMQQQKQIKVFALGGVTTKHINDLKQRGFDGAVVLGAIWKDIQGLKDRAILKQRIEQLITSCKTDLTS